MDKPSHWVTFFITFLTQCLGLSIFDPKQFLECIGLFNFNDRLLCKVIFSKEQTMDIELYISLIS